MSKGIHEPFVVSTDEAGLKQIHDEVFELGLEAAGDYARHVVPVLIAELRRLRGSIQWQTRTGDTFASPVGGSNPLKLTQAQLMPLAERIARGEFHGMSAEYIADKVRGESFGAAGEE